MPPGRNGRLLGRPAGRPVASGPGPRLRPPVQQPGVRHNLLLSSPSAQVIRTCSGHRSAAGGEPGVPSAPRASWPRTTGSAQRFRRVEFPGPNGQVISGAGPRAGGGQAAGQPCTASPASPNLLAHRWPARGEVAEVSRPSRSSIRLGPDRQDLTGCAARNPAVPPGVSPGPARRGQQGDGLTGPARPRGEQGGRTSRRRRRCAIPPPEFGSRRR